MWTHWGSSQGLSIIPPKLCILYFVALGTEPRFLIVLGKRSLIELHHQPCLFALNTIFQCSHFQSANCLGTCCLCSFGLFEPLNSFSPHDDKLLWPCSTIDFFILLFCFCRWWFGSLIHLEFLLLHLVLSVILGWFVRQEGGGRNLMATNLNQKFRKCLASPTFVFFNVSSLIF